MISYSKAQLLDMNSHIKYGFNWIKEECGIWSTSIIERADTSNLFVFGIFYL